MTNKQAYKNYMLEKEAFGCTSVSYDPDTELVTFFFRNGQVTTIDSRLIQGFVPNWELSDLAIRFPETDTDLSFKGIFEGSYGTKLWMQAIEKLKYKGYQGVWDGSHGRILLPKDIVTFYAETLDSAYLEFIASIEDYEEFKNELSATS